MPKHQPQLNCRPPWERILRLHQLLQNREFPNCTTVAREFEVSTRTILRDIEFMQERLKLPIEYDEARWGYSYTRSVDQLPGLPMTEGEMFALLVAHKAIAQYQGTPFQQPLAAAFRKLTGQLDGSTRYTLHNLDEALSFRPFAPDTADLETFQALTRALQERRVVRFQYRNLGAKQAQRRTVHPYHLACIENHWYLFAFDVNRQAMRTFVLTRLSRPQLEQERFEKPRRFNPDEYLRGSLTVFKGEGDYEVVVDFDAWATDLVRGRRWHATQELTELPDGTSRLRLRLDNLEEMERWVLSWGMHATVVRPRELARRIQRTTATLAERYRRMEMERT
jgi:proteasome accessory factor B